DAKVEDLGADFIPLVGEENILGFEVTMDDALAVEAFERGGDILQNLEGLIGFARAETESATEIVSLKQLHHEIGRAIVQKIIIEHLDDARMTDGGGDLGLTPEPRLRGFIGRKMKHLEGDTFWQTDHLRKIDRAHPAL